MFAPFFGAKLGPRNENHGLFPLHPPRHNITHGAGEGASEYSRKSKENGWPESSGRVFTGGVPAHTLGRPKEPVLDVSFFYGTTVPLLWHVAALPSADERITPDWSVQNALRP